MVLMEFTADANQAFHDRVEAYADQIRRLPYVKHYVFLRNLASRSGGLAWVVFGSFARSADHDAYQASDVHQEMKAYMTPFIARIIACDVDEEQA